MNFAFLLVGMDGVNMALHSDKVYAALHLWR